MRNTFSNPNAEAQLQKDGYIVLPNIGQGPLELAREIYQSHHAGVAEGFYTSVHAQDQGYRAQVSKALSDLFAPLVLPFFDRHRVVAASFVVKHPGKESHLAYHQDWNMVDESQFESVNFWFPLVPLTEENGPMHFIKGSHLLPKVLRGSPGLPSPLDGIAWEDLRPLFDSAKLNFGDALVHYNRLVHYSPANVTEEVRVAVLMTLVPEEADLLHYFQNEKGQLERYATQPGFFTSFVIGERPKFPMVGEPFDYQVEKWPIELLKKPSPIQKIIHFLQKEQKPDGEFPSLEIYPPGHPRHGEGWLYTDPSPFITANILCCLRQMEGKEVEEIRQRSLGFIQSNQGPYGLFRFWKHGGNTFNVPPDADDTALCSYVLSFKGLSIDNKKLFLKNRDRSGYFYTWFVAKPMFWWRFGLYSFLKKDRAACKEVYHFEMLHPDDAEPAVAANVLLYLGETPETEKSVGAIVEQVQKGQYPMQFYEDELVVFYHIARAYAAGVKGFEPLKNQILTAAKSRLNDSSVFFKALAVSIFGFFEQKDLAVDAAADELIKLAESNYEWEACPYFTSKSRIFKAGSPALTAAMVAEAIFQAKKCQREL